MQEIELPAGIIEYEDTGGSRPIVVLLHGLVMDGSVWHKVVQELRSDHRCVLPTMPLGSHRRPMRADADLSPRDIAKLQAEFLEALDLRDVTLVGNDSGVFQFTAGLYPERIARLVITPCEAFENFPPGLPGRTADVGIKMPGGTFLLAQAMRVPAAHLWVDGEATGSRRDFRCLAASSADPARSAPRSRQVRAYVQERGHARRG